MAAWGRLGQDPKDSHYQRCKVSFPDPTTATPTTTTAPTTMTPTTLPPYKRQKTLVPGWSRPSKGQQRGVWSDLGISLADVTFSFVGLVTQINPNWVNIFHVGNQDSERHPGIWVIPNRSAIHFRVGSTGNANDGGDVNVPFYEVFHFAATISGRTLKLFVNQKLANTVTLSGDPLLPQGDKVWFSNPWYEAAAVDVRDFSIFPNALSDSDVALIDGVTSCGSDRGCFGATTSGANAVNVLGAFGMGPWGGASGFADGSAQWIWNQAGAASNADNEPVAFVKLYVNSGSSDVTATFHSIVDNVATLSVNGVKITDYGGGWGSTQYPRYQIVLKSGVNLIVVTAANQGGPAGLLCSAIQSGSSTVLFRSDSSWAWLRPEVFHVTGYNYTRAEAATRCGDFGAQLATRGQLDASFRAGADWCSSGHLSDADAAYPINTSVVSGCAGNPTVAVWGGAGDKRGANCFGLRPVKDTAGVAPFNSTRWNTAPKYPSPQVTLYEHCDYQGASASLGEGQYNMGEFGLGNDVLSSIRIPAGMRVKLYEHSNFQGASVELTADTSCLVNNGWNDRMSSLQVFRVPSPTTCNEAKVQYWTEQPDVKAANMDAWQHYTQFGKNEGRRWPGPDC